MTEDDSAYRGQLAAAHARIAALEAELGKRSDPKIQELENQRAKLAKVAEPRQIRRMALFLPLLVGGVLSIPALIAAFTEPSKELLLLPLAGLVIGGILAALHVLLTPSSTRAAIAAIDDKIAEARRLIALEDEMRETRRMLESMPKTRVADAEAEPIEPEEESAARRKA